MERRVLLSVLFAVFAFLLGTGESFSQPAEQRSTAPTHLNDVQKKEDEIFYPILNPTEPGFDEWYSPHLRDITISQRSRDAHIYRRAEAGVGNAELVSAGKCYGACGQCDWQDADRVQACCGVQTEAYANLSDDSNFKTCCVRDGEEDLSEEEIACRHPTGDGWAGLYEYYYPVNALEWNSQPATTSLATAEIVRKCVEESDAMMSVAMSGGPNEEKSFTQQKKGEGALTEAVNVSSMSPAKRRELARYYCMHDEQFLKLIDPEEDPLQRGGGKRVEDFLQSIPLWANYCPAAVKLMVDPDETALIHNIDETPTDLFRGLLASRKDANICAEQGGWTGEKVAGCLPDPADPGKDLYQMSPVTFGQPGEYAPTPYQRAVQFAVAGGYYKGGMVTGERRFYKPFEPRPYTDSVALFRGRRVEGGGSNELGRVCGVYKGKDLTKTNQPDKIFTSSASTPSKVHYWAAFRAFATCPGGYQVWKGLHSEARGCGQEFFGGKQLRQK
jgi:hypothetical protein